MNRHPVESLSAYVDGELPPDEAAAIEAHLASCTECAREVMQIRSLGGMMREIGPIRPEPKLAERVNRRLARPVGWILFVVGALFWATLAIRDWFREDFTLERLAVTAIVIGLGMLAVSVGYEQYREWRESRYRDIRQ